MTVGIGGDASACDASADSATSDRSRDETPFPIPLSCVDVLGRSVIERMVERFAGADVEAVSVLVHASISHLVPAFRRSFEKLEVQVVEDMQFAIGQTLKHYAESGVDFAFVTDANTYAECDLIDLLWFHRGSRQVITRTFDREGALNFWVATCAKAHESDLAILFSKTEETGSASYFISDYLTRLAHPRDVRRLVECVLRGRCEMRPLGQEVRPGVWVDDGAQIHKRARIVAPAYIGRESVVREDSVITRFSNIEKQSYIDYGTVIEDSSILTNSYVGIWLDVAHAVVRGNRLWNLTRNVMLKISDPSVIRRNVPPQNKIRGGLNVPPPLGLLAFAPLG